jgi:hypothetical protein
MTNGRALALALLAGTGALAGCAKLDPVAELARPTPVFDPARFFTGRTAGEGQLDLKFKDPEQIRVQGEGQMLVDGTLVLNQIVNRGARQPQRRQWRLRPSGPGRWQGMLTDATDLVQAEVSGNQLAIRYPMKDGVRATQFLYLQPDGRTALNRMTFTMAGVKVGELNETIRKLD